ncbi:MAG: hypothetical protein CVV52_08350 [Spirochaetae bacterium HGW-Spirochaetae-8]|nr:MAG: hypothetical protein CVV52_08350 [Spirochaetae bacterium HGW-Spirochaetae-8]
MLSNIQIENMMNQGLINISPYNPDQLGLNHYKLKIDSLLLRKADDEYALNMHPYDLSSNPYALSPNEYVVIVVKEIILLGKGVFGEFYPASLNIEKGLILNCGRLNSFYERPIHFGLMYVGPTEYILRKDDEIARVSFEYIGSDTPIDYKKKDKDLNYQIMLEQTRKTQQEIQELEKNLLKKKKLLDNLKRLN